MRIGLDLRVPILCVALAVVVGATGCSPSSRDGTKAAPETAQGATQSIEASVSGEAAAAGDASVEIESDAISPDTSPGTSPDTDAVIRELDAIERELGGMDLPSETDFDSLEGDIR